jgi:hypothetical protein
MRIKPGGTVESNIHTTMSTAPYFSNASSKRDSWSSQLTTLHLVATAFLRWKTGTGQSRVTSGRESKMTHPPSLVMADTTACAPGTSKSPITTLALNSNIIHGWRQELYWYDLPVLRESQGHLLADTVRAPCVVCSSDTYMRQSLCITYP